MFCLLGRREAPFRKAGAPKFETTVGWGLGVQGSTTSFMDFMGFGVSDFGRGLGFVMIAWESKLGVQDL